MNTMSCTQSLQRSILYGENYSAKYSAYTAGVGGNFCPAKIFICTRALKCFQVDKLIVFTKLKHPITQTEVYDISCIPLVNPQLVWDNWGYIRAGLGGTCIISGVDVRVASLIKYSTTIQFLEGLFSLWRMQVPTYILPYVF